jgi:hypothetical protein
MTQDAASTADAYERGHAAGYAEAVHRETAGDAAAGDAAATWFTLPADVAAAAAGDYETGFTAGWLDYFAGRNEE